MFQSIKNRLKEPATRPLDHNSNDMSLVHREVLRSKRLLRNLFANFYRRCRTADVRYFGDTPGLRLELGSGSSIIKDFYPDVLTSDIKALPFVDRVVDAQAMPFENGTLRAIYGINLFHHLPSPRDFFREAIRVLAPGGGVVLIEPYHGALARWLFPRLHDSERFDPLVPDWENNDQVGPCLNANQALSYVIFKRDRKRYNDEFPELPVVFNQPHTHLAYFLSGGVNFRQLIPDMLCGLVGMGEFVLSPLNRSISLQHTIVLRKVK